MNREEKRKLAERNSEFGEIVRELALFMGKKSKQKDQPLYSVKLAEVEKERFSRQADELMSIIFNPKSPEGKKKDAQSTLERVNQRITELEMMLKNKPH